MDKPASSIGIQNGLTTVLRTGVSFLWKALNFSLDKPFVGMRNILSPHQASSGVRLIIGNNNNMAKIPSQFKDEQVLKSISIRSSFCLSDIIRMSVSKVDGKLVIESTF